MREFQTFFRLAALVGGMKRMWGYRETSVLLRAVVLSCVLTTGISGASAVAATIQQITNFGANPTGIGMYLYTPANVVAKPPVLVGIHACHGRGTDVCSSGSPFAAQADKYGFLLICPSAVSADGCWDVHSTADLTHNGGGDASGIISMVNYVLQNKNGDVDRVYVAGHSSGGMMTNIMLGSYPDVFKAGAAYAGVAFGCFASGPVDSLGWNATCANGNVTKSGAQWGDMVRAAFPAFSGTRPRMQLWHGTVDAIVNFHNFGEEIKEWTNVLGVSETPISTENNALQSTWIRTRYADSAGVIQIEAIQETGQPHNLVVNAAEAIRFFGLDGSAPPPQRDGGGAADGPRDAGDGDRMAAGGATATGDGGGTMGTGGVTGTGTAGGRGGTGGPGSGDSGGAMQTGGSSSGGGNGVTTGGTTGAGSGGATTSRAADAGSNDSGAAGGVPSASSSGCAGGCSWSANQSLPPTPVGLAVVAALLLLQRRRRHR